jgi:transcriptional regulator with XRE-family HTH domain
MTDFKDRFSEFLADPENARLFQRERLILEATQMIYELMEKKKVSKSALARRLGRSPAFVTQVLDGDRNMTLSTFSDMFTALDAQAHFFHQPLSHLPRPEIVLIVHRPETTDEVYLESEPQPEQPTGKEWNLDLECAGDIGRLAG